MAMMSSAALPKLEFIRPPRPAPSLCEMTLVASPIRRARGIRAKLQRAKVLVPG